MKRTIDEFALLGGSPTFEETLHVGRPNLGDRESLLQRMAEIYDRGWLTNDGPLVREFEERVARQIGVRHCLAMCNGTVALEIAIRALDLRGEVIMPSYTFIATAHALGWQEITPVFCDIDPRSHAIDPDRIEALITPRTSAILGVHLWGRPCDVDRLEEIAQRRKLVLLFDAAHAFGCSHRGRMIGSFGRAEVFSFHATKFVNCFEGGAVVTDDDELAEKMRLMRNFGFVDYDEVVYIGTNGKMSEASAAMGLTSLDAMESFVEVNRRNYHLYRDGLAGIPGLDLLEYDEREQGNFQYIVVEVDEPRCGLSRDEVIQLLHAENVLARRYFFPGCHRMEPYRSFFPNAHLLLPRTEALASRVVVLPTGTAMSEEKVRTVTELLRAAQAFGPELAVRLRARPASNPARPRAGVGSRTI